MKGECNCGAIRYHLKNRLVMCICAIVLFAVNQQVVVESLWLLLKTSIFSG